MAVQPGGTRRSPGGESDSGVSLPIKLSSPDGPTWDFRACKFTSSLVARAYAASGQAAFNLHAMAYLQVYRAKVLKDLHEGGPNLEMIQELHSVTDYALQAMKVMPHALWRGCPH